MDKLKGHELDTAVAHEVVGLQKRPVSEIYEEGHVPEDLEPGEERWRFKIGSDRYQISQHPPPYSSDITYVKRALQGMAGFQVIEEDQGFKANIDTGDLNREATGTTAAEAVCRAALKAVRDR